MKKIIASLLCISLLMSVFSANAFALISESTGTEEQLISEANEAFWNKNFCKARYNISQLLNESQRNIPETRLLVNLAICDAQLGDWEEAEKEARLSIKLADKNSMTEADGLVVLGRCLILENEISKAKEIYKQALDIASKHLGEWNCDLVIIYEGLAACAVREKDFPVAESLYKKVSQLDYLKYGADDPHLAWSFLSLHMALSALGKNDLAHTLYKKVFWNFRHQNEERILAEVNPQDDEKEAIVKELRRQLYGSSNGYENREQGLNYIKQGIPPAIIEKPISRPHDFNNWFPERTGRETAPGLAFFDPRTKLKALIVTVHGLGLYNGAYKPFAERVQHQGFGVISFDVRGFGSYRNDEIYQKVDFKAIIADFHRILSELREDYPQLPIFILGESMGGAIALRITAMFPELVDGVVSSVPSGTRFQAKSTALEVAVRFLKNSHKPFNIGQRVIEQATTNPQLRQAWEDDPRARMTFSPTELIQFQKFMNDNLKYAEQITCKPVIIFQGYCDELVKPLSTLALYQAISAKDKDLIFVGHAQHLIFEQGQFDQDIVDGLMSWLDKHIATDNKQ